MKTFVVEAVRMDTEKPEDYATQVEARTVEEASELAQRKAWNEVGAQCDLRIFNVYWI